jgi:hypothetical protein
MPTNLQIRRGLQSALPTGLAGEPLFTTDTKRLYISDGTATNLLQGAATLLTTGAIPFSDANGKLTMSASNLYWDDTNNRLGIGTASPTAIIHSVGSVTASSAIARGNFLQPTLVAAANGDTLYALDIIPTYTVGAFTGVSSVSLRIRNATNTGNAFFVDSVGNATLGASLSVGTVYGGTNINLSSGGGNLLLQTNFAANTGLTMFNSTRNVVIQNGGTFTDAGFKLDVNGTARISGLTRSTDVFVVGGAATTNTANTRFWSAGGQAPTAVGLYRSFFADIAWIPSSGSSEWYGLDLRPTINQTGTANGVTRGIYIAPTLTSAADFRAIETTAGNVLFGASGTGFYWDNTNNRLGIGTATPDRPLQIVTSGNTGLRIDNVGGGANAIFLGNANSLIRWSNGSYFSNTGMYSVGNDQQYITFDGTNTQVRLQIKASNGNIGIGTTTDVGFKLDVNGTARVTGNITGNAAITAATQITAGLINEAGARYIINGSSVGRNWQIANNWNVGGGFEITPSTAVGGSTFTTPSFVIAGATGNVGIGTNAPNRTFVVYNESAPHIQLATAASGLTTSSGFQLRIVSNNVLFTNFQASNMVFGNSGATHVTLFNSGNLLVSSTTTTDAGFKLDVNGSVRATGSISAASAIARGTYLNQTLVATANNDVLVGLDIASTFTTGAFTGTTSAALRVNGAIINLGSQPNIGTSANSFGTLVIRNVRSDVDLSLGAGYSATGENGLRMFSSTRNVVIQSGGTFTDIASARLAVNSTTQGFLPPRMTTTQKNAIASPATGLMVYDTTLNLISVYNGTMWISL